MFSLHTRVEL